MAISNYLPKIFHLLEMIANKQNVHVNVMRRINLSLSFRKIRKTIKNIVFGHVGIYY